ncbi:MULTISPECIES: RHS repeat-associated core domain-containing protein [Pirellulaceae]|uniref:RHS repeat-associated core domain-containing protein n=1 Tax=Pirellulaceae TaxID=2691357 RepID=UPI0013047E0D|nr:MULTISPECIES: RHS repeat-associated core domain-containing protein [Pirellulaceae]
MLGAKRESKPLHSVALSDANGNIVGLIPEAEDYLNRLITYDPYGTPTDENDFRQLFGGYYYDSDTGLYLVRNRVYHPKLGRWLTKDPLGMVDGPNLYEYCAGDPVNLIDPSGTVSFWDDPLDWAYGSGGAIWDVGASNSWLGRAYQASGQGMAEMIGPEYLAQAGGWELAGLTAAAATAGVLGGWAASSVAGTIGLGYWSTLAFSGAVAGGAEYLTWTLGAQALGGNLAAGPTLSGLGMHVGGGAVGGVAFGAVGGIIGRGTSKLFGAGARPSKLYIHTWKGPWRGDVAEAGLGGRLWATPYSEAELKAMWAIRRIWHVGRAELPTGTAEVTGSALDEFVRVRGIGLFRLGWKRAGGQYFSRGPGDINLQTGIRTSNFGATLRYLTMSIGSYTMDASLDAAIVFSIYAFANGGYKRTIDQLYGIPR